jgi:hypothetical protein
LPLAAAEFDDADAPACAEAAALGPGFGVAVAEGLGAVLAWASPVSRRELAAVATIKAGIRAMPARRIHINVGPLRQLRRHHRGAVPKDIEGTSRSHAMTTLS